MKLLQLVTEHRQSRFQKGDSHDFGPKEPTVNVVHVCSYARWAPVCRGAKIPQGQAKPA